MEEVPIPPYKNPNESIEVRVEDLISRMTLEEKIGQMTMMGRVKSKRSDGSIDPLIVGGANGGRGPYEYDPAPVEKWAEMADKWQEAALKSRLGIPLMLGVDAVHGHNNAYRTTIFPHNIGLGATGDEDLIRRIGEATAMELRAAGLNYTFAPCVAVVKDLRWNRCYESYSEDTEIVRRMTSIIAGLQGSPPDGYEDKYPFVARGGNNVIACAKHFVGDGGTEGGITEGDTKMEYERLERDHIAPYLDCISQNVCTIMASFSSYNGQKMHSHKFLLTDVLKGKLQFKGLIISDWRGVEKINQWKEGDDADYYICAALAINAGIDMVLGPPDPENFQRALVSLVEESKVVPVSRIDDAVKRILRVKFAAGIFDLPISKRPSPDVVYCEMHREIARESVRKSLVLLKNGKSKPFLPLDKNARKILVAGNHANNLGYQCGAWSIYRNGENADRKNGITILEAIKEAVGHDTEVEFEIYPSSNTLSSAKDQFEYAIVAVGERPYAEYLPSETGPFLQPNIVDMICSVADKVPTLLILISGRPIELKGEMLEKVEGLIAAWLPGTEGNGITDVIFGDYDFVGKLPVAWFKSVDQLSMDHEARTHDPLFQVGFGLGYGSEGEVGTGSPSFKRLPI